ncbi:hypothetical protein JOM56_009143 [Amanita muscaria]
MNDFFGVYHSGSMQAPLHTVFMGRILDRNFAVPAIRIIKEGAHVRLYHINDRGKSMGEWRRRENPNSVTIIKAMLAVAKAFQYFHSLGIILDDDCVSLKHIILDSKLCARIVFLSDLDNRWTFETIIFSFGCFFYETYFNVEINNLDRWTFQRSVIVERPSEPNIRDDAWELIQRCCGGSKESANYRRGRTRNGVMEFGLKRLCLLSFCWSYYTRFGREIFIVYFVC